MAIDVRPFHVQLALYLELKKNLVQHQQLVVEKNSDQGQLWVGQ
jgi:hypothetical protein